MRMLRKAEEMCFLTKLSNLRSYSEILTSVNATIGNIINAKVMYTLVSFY